jgi:hypothetical protein
MSKPGTERGYIDIEGRWVTDAIVGPDGVTLIPVTPVKIDELES